MPRVHKTGTKDEQLEMLTADEVAELLEVHH